MIAGLLLLLASCVISLLLVAQSRLQRVEALGLALFVLVVFCVGLGGLLAGALHDVQLGDGRSLIACAVGPLMALLWRDALEQRFAGPLIGTASATLLFVGLGGQALALRGHPFAVVVVVVALVLAVVVSALVGVSALRRAMLAPARLHRHRVRTEAGGALLLTLAAVVALVDLVVGHDVAPGAWAAAVAVAVVCAAGARATTAPLVWRDVVAVLAAAPLLVLTVPLSLVPIAVAAVAIAVVAAGAAGVSAVAAVDVSRVLGPTPSTVAAVEPGLAGLAPLLDDARQRRPQRPRVLSRTAARRLVESAIANAWRAQPQAKGRAPVDVVGSDDADLDGDPGELAEALCAILDNALRDHARHPQRRVAVAIRATAQTIAFEVDAGADTAITGERRPFLSITDDDERAGFGVSLSRARLLIERHGGQLSVGQGDGAVVHVSLPRRLPKSPLGLA